MRERVDGRADRDELGSRERVEPRREPRRAAGADAAQRALALIRQRQPDLAAVGLALRARDETVALEPRDALRHRGGRDALLGGELADGDAGRVLDRDEEADLVRRDAGDLLPAQLARELQDGRAE